MKRLALAAAACLLAGAACGEEADPVPDRPTATPAVEATARSGTRTVTDMAGRSTSLPDDVMSVAAMSPSAVEFARALGLEVVTRPSETPETEAPGAKPAGSTIAPDFAAIAAAMPDLVLADATYHSGRTRDFDRFAFPVFTIKVNSYNEVLQAFDALGTATGRGAEATLARQAVEAQAERAFAAARDRGRATAAPKVLILTGGGRDVFAGGNASYLGDLVVRLGGANVLAGAADGGPIAGFGVVEVSQAALLMPDVVLILPSGQGGLAAQLKTDPAWAATPAVKAGRVHDLDTGLYLRAPGPRVGEALAGLGTLLWP